LYCRVSGVKHVQLESFQSLAESNDRLEAGLTTARGR
jgi:hypothetical protein